MERRTIHYAGRVQGVGFRWTAYNALRDLPVAGFVRNLTDGRVEMVVEGKEEALEAALERIRIALGAGIASETANRAAATGEFPDFRIER